MGKENTNNATLTEDDENSGTEISEHDVLNGSDSKKDHENLLISRTVLKEPTFL
mgnify:CR=1 FL=1